MKLALAQLDTIVGDLRGNAAKILAAYQQASAAGATLVLTPELALTGYPPRDLLTKRRFVPDNLRALDELAPQIGPTALLVGYVELNLQRPGKDYYNAVALIQNGKILARRFKSRLPTYDVFDEDRYFQPAATSAPITLNGQSLALTICEDVWTEEFLPAKLYPRDPVAEMWQAAGPPSIILNVSASPYHLGKAKARYEMLRGVARRYRVPLAYCNLVGGNDELIFDGHSMVFDSAGNLVAQAAPFREELLLVDLAHTTPQPFGEPETTAALHDALVLGLRDYTRKCDFKSVVLGLSGGIDSAVTACLAVVALGPGNVLGVSLPSEFSSPGSIADARALAKNLGIRWELVPIQEIFQTFKAALKPLFQGRPEDAAEENIQARIRGTLLMGLSNKFGHLLLTTGNKSELGVGYCTLYGDMAGGLAVIADVPKTTVYQLARYINRDRPIIPEASITKPPSAELRPNQTDQDSLPPYETLDTVLRKYVEETKSTSEIVAETHLDEKLVRSIVRLIDLNEYKRKQAPPCLRVTTKAFGIGRRVPIAQRYVER